MKLSGLNNTQALNFKAKQKEPNPEVQKAVNIINTAFDKTVSGAAIGAGIGVSIPLARRELFILNTKRKISNLVNDIQSGFTQLVKNNADKKDVFTYNIDIKRNPDLNMFVTDTFKGRRPVGFILSEGSDKYFNKIKKSAQSGIAESIREDTKKFIEKRMGILGITGLALGALAGFTLYIKSLANKKAGKN